MNKKPEPDLSKLPRGMLHNGEVTFDLKLFLTHIPLQLVKTSVKSAAHYTVNGFMCILTKMRYILSQRAMGQTGSPTRAKTHRQCAHEDEIPRNGQKPCGRCRVGTEGDISHSDFKEQCHLSCYKLL